MMGDKTPEFSVVTNCTKCRNCWCGRFWRRLSALAVIMRHVSHFVWTKKRRKKQKQKQHFVCDGVPASAGLVRPRLHGDPVPRGERGQINLVPRRLLMVQCVDICVVGPRRRLLHRYCSTSTTFLRPRKLEPLYDHPHLARLLNVISVVRRSLLAGFLRDRHRPSWLQGRILVIRLLLLGIACRVTPHRTPVTVRWWQFVSCK